jgi:L-rhamnono-1,4-lactonase
MKFSGCFSEFGKQAPGSVDEVVQRISYYVQKAFELFGPKRIMFGSDWPVCNIGGPDGEQSWTVWTDVVKAWLDRQAELDNQARKRVWWGTGIEAYDIDTALISDG